MEAIISPGHPVRLEGIRNIDRTGPLLGLGIYCGLIDFNSFGFRIFFIVFYGHECSSCMCFCAPCTCLIFKEVWRGVSEPQKMEWRIVVIHHVGAWNWTGYSPSMASPLNCSAISPCPRITLSIDIFANEYKFLFERIIELTIDSKRREFCYFYRNHACGRERKQRSNDHEVGICLCLLHWGTSVKIILQTSTVLLAMKNWANVMHLAMN